MNKDQTVRDLAKTPAEIPIPDFAGLQKRSYESFTQLSSESGERRDQGLEGMLRALFPVKLPDGAQLEYRGYEVDPPALSSWDCERFARTFSAELRILLRAEGENGGEATPFVLPLI